MAENKLQWKRIAKGERLPYDSLLMKKDGTITPVVSSATFEACQDAYYLPVEEIRTLPKEESGLTWEDIDTITLEYVKKSNPTLSKFITKENLRASYYLRGEYDTYRQGLIDMFRILKKGQL